MGYLRSPEHTASHLENPEALHLFVLFSCQRLSSVLYARRWFEHSPLLLSTKLYMDRYNNCPDLVGFRQFNSNLLISSAYGAR